MSGPDPVPAAVGGHRLRFAELPAAVRERVVRAAGAAVLNEDSRPGGFSPGVASRLTLADGRKVFVKAVSAARNPHTPAMHRREAVTLAALPPTVPAPRLVEAFDHGDWAVLVVSDVDGRTPTLPWSRAELDEVVAAIAELAVAGTPCPVPGLPAAADDLAEELTGFRTLAGAPSVDPRLDPWVADRLDALAGLESGWPEALAGDSLLHGDLRADNVLLTEGGVVFVDWPAAFVGAPWFDLLAMLPSVAMQGGPDPATVWAAYRPGVGVDPDAVTAALAGIAGYFVSRSLQPPPPLLERVRPFQAAQGREAVRWLRRRLPD